jgi:transcriptional regulator with XRE-family HTH domain
VSACGSPAREARQLALGPDKRERDQLLLAFGQNLRTQWVLVGLSQHVLAERCFLRPGQVSHLERGRTAPGLLVLLLRADATGVEIGELVSGLGAPSRRANREQILALGAQHPGISTAELAGALRLPARYTFQTARRMYAYKEIVWRRTSWQPSLELAPGDVGR